MARIAFRTADHIAASARASVEMRSSRGAPLALALRAASSIVGRLEKSTFAVATPTQQVLLGAAAAQLRAAAGCILASSGGSDCVESSLGELVARTLALVDEAMVPPVTLESRIPSPTHTLPPCVTDQSVTSRRPGC